MRVAREVSALFSDPGFIRKANILSGAKGGWERWFQLELACHIAVSYMEGYEVTLEDSTVYPGTHMRADLVLKGRRFSKTTTVVELKCQTATETIEDFFDRIEDDIANIPDLAPGNDYQVIALIRDREDIEPLYGALARNHPGQMERFPFDTSLISPGGFVSFYQGAKWG